jgi:prepilin-type N-terminal cleavage/methylation domain-containing protein
LVSPGRSRCAGFTLLEVVLAASLLAILLTKTALMVQSATRFTNDTMSQSQLSDQAQRTIDRIAYAIMAAERSTLFPASPAPAWSETLDYRVSLGVEERAVIWADPERIGLDTNPMRLLYTTNPGALEQRQLVLSNIVRPFLEGEIPNGIDDNGNGIIDEKGLSFVVNEGSVTIRLTIGRQVAGQAVIEETLESTVMCRNLGEGL